MVRKQREGRDELFTFFLNVEYTPFSTNHADDSELQLSPVYTLLHVLFVVLSVVKVIIEDLKERRSKYVSFDKYHRLGKKESNNSSGDCTKQITL